MSQSIDFAVTPSVVSTENYIMYLQGDGAEEQGVIQVTNNNNNYDPDNPIALYSGVGQSTGTNSTLTGLYGAYIQVGDASSETDEKSKLACYAGDVNVLSLRSNTPYDDVAAVTLNNTGNYAGTDCIYVGNGVTPTNDPDWGTGVYDWNTILNVDGCAWYVIKANGSYKYGLDLSAATIVDSAIRLAYTQPIVAGSSTETEVVLLSSDGSGNALVSEAGATTFIRSSSLQVPNLPTSSSGLPSGSIWADPSDDYRLKWVP
jgi:hypothetical protein